MSDFRNRRSKKLDLVIHTPSSTPGARGRSLADLFAREDVLLDPAEKAALDALPALREAPVGGVLLALEAKACMTEHQKALPRLYDELNSSHLTVHGAHDGAIACGFLMINAAGTFVSPGPERRRLRRRGRRYPSCPATGDGARHREGPRAASPVESGRRGVRRLRDRRRRLPQRRLAGTAPRSSSGSPAR